MRRIESLPAYSKLKNLLKECVYISDEKEFVLSSGEKSDIYIDCREATLTALGHELVGHVFFTEIEELFPVHDLCVGGIALGGCPIASAIAFHGALVAPSESFNAFYVRPEAKDHGTKSRTVGKIHTKNVVLVEDVVTTGGSVIKAVDYLSSIGHTVLGVFTLVDRGGGENIKRHTEFYSLYKLQDLIMY